MNRTAGLNPVGYLLKREEIDPILDLEDQSFNSARNWICSFLN